MAILQWKQMTQLCPFWAQYTWKEVQNYGKCGAILAQGKKLNKFLWF